MAPHRAAAPVSKLAALLQAVPPAQAVATVLGVLTTIVTGLQSIAFVLLLGVMAVDVVTGVRRSRARPDEKFRAAAVFAGIWKKFLQVLLVVLAFMTDAMLITVSHATGLMEGTFDGGWLTLFVTAGLFYKEVHSSIDNVKRMNPKAVAAVWGFFRAALQAGRRMDEEKFKQIYGPAAVTPQRRASDAALAELEEAAEPAESHTDTGDRR